MYNGAPLEQVKQFIYLGASFNEKGDTIKEVKRRIAIAKRASTWRPAQDMEEQRATDPTEEKTCSINGLADNELRFRDMDLPKVSTEHDKSLWTIVLSKNAAHLMDGTCYQWGGV